MKHDTQTYLIGRKSSTLNRKVKKGSRVFLNGFLLQPGFDFTIQKRNIKFNIELEKDDVVEIDTAFQEDL